MKAFRVLFEDESLHSKVKASAALTGKTMNEFIVDILQNTINELENKKNNGKKDT